MALVGLKIEMEGTTPLLMHRGDLLIDPLSEVSKQMKRISSKRSKTDDDQLEMRRLEWYGGLYCGEAGPYVPAQNIERCFREAGTATKAGKAVQRALLIEADCPLLYRGPRTADELWDHGGFKSEMPVKVGQSRVIRCRPQFSEWSLEADALLDTTLLDLDAFTEIVERAGRSTGIGDFRPRFGRFEATVAKT